MFFTEIIGYLAGILITITMIPQIYVSLKTKSVKGVSLLMLIIFFSSMILWTIYGFLIKNYPLLITNGLATIISGIQVIIKLKFRN
jgi:MtN3 and saliva related transmembrane protein